MSRRTEHVVRVLFVVIVVSALVLFARGVNWSATWQAMRAASPALLAAAALANLASLVLKGTRWWVFLRPVGVASLFLALRATMAGAALNNVLIANGGEAARVVYVARAAHQPSARVLATLALERLFEIVGYVMMLALGVSFLTLPPQLAGTRPFALVALAVLTALLVYLVRHPEKAELPGLEGEGLLHRAREYGRGFLRTLTGISTGPRFAAALVLSLAVWALQIASYWLTAQAAGFGLSLVGTIAAVLAVNLGFAVRATPGNVGVFQVMYAVAAAAFGLDRDAAIGVALLIQAQQILPVMVLGLAAAPDMLRERRRETPRPDNIVPGEPAPDT